MASILEAFQAPQTTTVTNLSSLASSVTAGWRSAAIDNSINLYLNYVFELTLAAVNTAAGSQKALYVFGYGLVDTGATNYTTTGATSGGLPNGSEGTLTFPDITANSVNMPLIAIIPYVGQNTAINAQFSMSAMLGGLILPKVGIAIVNASGMTLGTATLKYAGTYNTVA